MTMASTTSSSLLATAKSSGLCSPSLISEDRVIDGGIFELTLIQSLDGGLNLSPDPAAVEAFSSALKMAATVAVPDSPFKTRVLEQRRCLLLVVTGSTGKTSPQSLTLRKILNSGFLVRVKAWLDDILGGVVGGVDLLLNLLSNIAPLPVTKEMVTTCSLGKAVVAILKHKICAGSPNEAAISRRVQNVKSSWSEAVKALKNNTNAVKRVSEDEGPAAKKAKRDAPKPALSSLLKKVESNSVKIAAEIIRPKDSENHDMPMDKVASADEEVESTKEGLAFPIFQKKDRRIRWADSSGKMLAVAHEKASLTTPALADVGSQDPRMNTTWSERKKKDLLNEKELLFQARKRGSFDDDKEDLLNAMSMMAGPWKHPLPLPEDKENLPVRVESKEKSVQNIRMTTVPASMNYASEDVVPISPTLLSEVEKALELSSFNTEPPKNIPFFAPPPVPAIPDATMVAYAAAVPNLIPTTEATLETVLTMGLPYFLVGSNITALQTLAAAPTLLATFRRENGSYDEQGLLNLVRTLTQNLAPPQASQIQTIGYAGVNHLQSTQSYYQPSLSLVQPGLYSAPTTLTSQVQSIQQDQVMSQQAQIASRGYRGDQNLGEANLHLSGYGPTTSNEDIVALFAPYVQVIEVVPKGNFSFVNTRDPEGAKRAREALNGSLLGGMPCRINMATRKIKNGLFDTMTTVTSAVSPLAVGDLSSLPRNSLGQVDFDQVRDDRGNPATKNLFIAGYGPGTTEQQLRDLVGQYATVVSVVLKQTFAFVNTTDRDAAVIARQSLGGQIVNGGPLRINFAKESGRLGTSFDSTYGPASAGLASYGRF